MMSRKELDLWVGVFVAIGLGAVLFLALKVANLSGFSASNSYSIVGRFDNIGGLKVRAPVKGAGVVVGRRWSPCRSTPATSSPATPRRRS
jgi:phospholipid/cholesterol/gamma-HCH transport system substrate-binding protein